MTFKVPERPSRLDPFSEKLTRWLFLEAAKSRKQRRTGRRLHSVRRAQLRCQQVSAAEDGERQVTGAVVIAMKKPSFLMAVDRIVGRIEIQDDLAGGGAVSVEKDIDEPGFDR